MVRPRALPDVVEEHFDELAELWERREGYLRDPEYTRADLGTLEVRAEAHRDGLFLAGDLAVELALVGLASADRPAVTAAAFVLLDRGEPELVKPVVALLREGDPESLAGLRIGLRHSPLHLLQAELDALSLDSDSLRALVALDVLTFQHAAYDGPQVRVPHALERLLRSEDPVERLLAYPVLARLGRSPADPWLSASLTAGVAPEEQRAALEAAARLAPDEVVPACRQAADHCGEALAFLGAFGAREDLPLFGELSGDSELAPAALRAMGAAGYPDSIDGLLARAQGEDELAVAALERILGESVPRRAIGPEASARPHDWDAEFVPEPHPVEPKALEALWQRSRSRFENGRRYQTGIALPAGSPAGILEALTLEARCDVAICAGLPHELPATMPPMIRAL